MKIQNIQSALAGVKRIDEVSDRAGAGDAGRFQHRKNLRRGSHRPIPTMCVLGMAMTATCCEI